MGSEVAVLGHSNGVAVVGPQFTDDQVSLLKRTICQGASDDEFQLFLGQCRRTKLDPFARQIHAVKRWDAKSGREVMSIQTGIDGYRLIADRTGEYEGQTAPMWCGPDGHWMDVWLFDEYPAAAKVGVHKKGFRDPVYSVALWKEYVQMFKPKGSSTLEVSPMWRKMGALMLSKCAEAQALRKAFPQELSGIYTNEEMQQADRQEPAQEPQPEMLQGPAVTDDVMKGWRKFRAKVTKSLQEAKTLDDLEKKRAGIEGMSGGTAVWSQRTYHDDFETFGSLFEQHKSRVERDASMAGPEGIATWIRGVMNAPSLQALTSFVAHFRENERFQTFECEGALMDRAKQLGLQSFTDLEAQEDEADEPQDAKG